MFPFDDVIMIKGLLKKSEESINVIMNGNSYFQENKSVHVLSFEIGTLCSYRFSNSLEKPLTRHWCAWNDRNMFIKLRKLRKSVTVLFPPLQRFRVRGYYCWLRFVLYLLDQWPIRKTWNQNWTICNFCTNKASFLLKCTQATIGYS